MQRWANHFGFIANSVTNDATGWDFYVEFSQTDSQYDNIALDLVPPPIKCYVQVKSSDGHPRRIRDKLSNWRHRIANAHPHFILMLEFGETDTPQNAFLVHVGEKLITKIIKRLRTIDPSENKLHKRYLVHKFEDDCRISPCDGTGFRRAVLSHVGEDPREYELEKLRFLKEVGYTDKRYQMTITFSGENLDHSSTKPVREFFLGLRPFKSIKAEVRDLRFGIPSLNPIEEFGEGIVSVTPHPLGDGCLQFKSDIMKNGPTIDGKWTSFAHDDNNNNLQGMLVFSSRWIKLVIDLSEVETNLRIHLPPEDQDYELFELFELATLFQFLGSSQPQSFTACLTIVVDDRRHSFDFDGQSSISLTPSQEAWCSIIQDAWSVVKYFDVYRTISVNIGDLVREYTRIQFMAQFVASDIGPVDLKLWSPEPVDTSTQVCIPFLCVAVFGGYRLVLMVTVKGALQPTGEMKDLEQEFQMSATDVSIFFKGISTAHQMDGASYDILMKRLEEEYGDNLILIDEFLDRDRLAIPD